MKAEIKHCTQCKRLSVVRKILGICIRCIEGVKDDKRVPFKNINPINDTLEGREIYPELQERNI